MTAAGSGETDSAVHIRVGGRVQGVGFRYFVQNAARSHGLVGWVRNLRDGDVELVAVGAREAVEALVLEVRQGPPISRVDRLDRRDFDPEGKFTAFEITY